MDLGQRIDQLHLRDADGRDVPVRRLAPGEFEAAEPASRFSYEVNLMPPVRAVDGAFVSWLNADQGLLMLGDLLPAPPEAAEGSEQVTPGVRIKFILPAGWTAGSANPTDHLGEFQVTDIGNAVFVVGRNLRTSGVRILSKHDGPIDLKLIDTGPWAFADDEALSLAAKIIELHATVLNGSPGRSAVIVMMPFPVSVTPEKWSAETRGSTVTLLLGRQASRLQALAQLSVPLTHELFHLWVPNNLMLQGEYVWFYEGFTVYQAARTAVRLQLLTFDDFLSAVGRAYGAYLSSADRDRYSLVEASQRRWMGSETTVYQKAMLVAFLYDLRLRLQSRGKRSLDDVYREVFRRNRVSAGARGDGIGKANGTEVAIAMLNAEGGMANFAPTFIQRTVAIDLESELASFGLRVERAGSRSRVIVNELLTKRQRDLLRQLGYNDRVRSTGDARSRG